MCSAALEEMLSYFCEQQDCWTDILTVADETLFHPFLTIFLLHLWFSQSDKKKKKDFQNEEYLSRRPRAHCLKPDRPVMSRCSWAMIAVQGRFRKRRQSLKVEKENGNSIVQRIRNSSDKIIDQSGRGKRNWLLPKWVIYLYHIKSVQHNCKYGSKTFGNCRLRKFVFRDVSSLYSRVSLSLTCHSSTGATTVMKLTTALIHSGVAVQHDSEPGWTTTEAWDWTT